MYENLFYFALKFTVSENVPNMKPVRYAHVLRVVE